MGIERERNVMAESRPKRSDRLSRREGIENEAGVSVCVCVLCNFPSAEEEIKDSARGPLTIEIRKEEEVRGRKNSQDRKSSSVVILLPPSSVTPGS